MFARAEIGCDDATIGFAVVEIGCKGGGLRFAFSGIF